MRLSLALPVLVLLLAPATLSFAPPAEAVACASAPPPGPGLVEATVYFARKTVSDNCGNVLWYGCFVVTVLLGPGNCPA